MSFFVALTFVRPHGALSRDVYRVVMKCILINFFAKMDVFYNLQNIYNHWATSMSAPIDPVQSSALCVQFNQVRHINVAFPLCPPPVQDNSSMAVGMRKCYRLYSITNGEELQLVHEQGLFIFSGNG
jgi:hypothetical protein